MNKSTEQDFISEGGLVFFDGIRFVAWDERKQYKEWVNRPSFRHFGIQYNHKGTLNYQFTGQTMKQVNGPHAWITFPEHACVFGPRDEEPRHHL